MALSRCMGTHLVDPTFITSILSTGVGTLLAGGVAWLIYRRQRHLPYWIVVGGGAGGSATDVYIAGFELANAGSGAAFAIRLEGSHCDTDLLSAHQIQEKHQIDFDRQGARLIPACLPGESVHIRVRLVESDWDRAAVTCTWVQDTSRNPPRHVKKVWRMNQFRDYEGMQVRIGTSPLES